MAAPLVSNGRIIRLYEYYATLRTQDAWRVPLLLGKLPARPSEEATSEERGHYALFIMLLFRPWRGYHCADFLSNLLVGHSSPLLDAVAWDLVWNDFKKWREDDIDAVAKTYFDRSLPVSDPPAFDTREWWSCLISTRLRNLELASHHRGAAFTAAPSDFSVIPFATSPIPDIASRDDSCGSGPDDGEPMQLSEEDRDRDDANGFDDQEEKETAVRESFPQSEFSAGRCGSLPSGISLEDLVSWPVLRTSRVRVSVEERFLSI